MIEMTNEQLVIRIKAGENVAQNMERLYDQVKNFIHSIAWKYRDSGELEDLEQEGYLALYPAIDGYDPDTGYKFLTYAEYHIRQRMQRYLQMNGSCLRLPVHCMEQVRKYDRFRHSFMREYGREPSEYECAAYFGFSLEHIQHIRKSACMVKVGSLDSPVTGADGGEDATVGDFVPDSADLEEDVTERLQHEQLSEVLWDMVDSLEGKQPEVIRQRYQEGLTLSEIGRQQGTTMEAVRQIHNKALRKLRNPARSKQLRPFFPETDRLYSRALIGGGVGNFNHTWTSSTEREALNMIDRWELEEQRRQENLTYLQKLREQIRERQQEKEACGDIG